MIIDRNRFEEVLPTYFKTKNFTSFVRQLNMYNFTRVRNKEKIYEFRNEHFRRGSQDSLQNIKRRPVNNPKKEGRIADQKPTVGLFDSMIRDLDLTFAMNHQAFTFYQSEAYNSKTQSRSSDALSFLKLLCLNFYNTAEPKYDPNVQTLKQELYSYIQSLNLQLSDNASITDMLEILKIFIESNQCNTFSHDQLRKIWLKYYFSDATNNKSIFVTNNDKVTPKETITNNSKNCIDIDSEQDIAEIQMNVSEKIFNFSFEEGVLVLPTVVKKINGKEMEIERSSEDSFDVDFRDYLKNNLNIK
jgi:hypothetical protein